MFESFDGKLPIFNEIKLSEELVKSVILGENFEMINFVSYSFWNLVDGIYLCA